MRRAVGVLAAAAVAASIGGCSTGGGQPTRATPWPSRQRPPRRRRRARRRPPRPPRRGPRPRRRPAQNPALATALNNLAAHSRALKSNAALAGVRARSRPAWPRPARVWRRREPRHARAPVRGAEPVAGGWPRPAPVPRWWRGPRPRCRRWERPGSGDCPAGVDLVGPHAGCQGEAGGCSQRHGDRGGAQGGSGTGSPRRPRLWRPSARPPPRA